MLDLEYSRYLLIGAFGLVVRFGGGLGRDCFFVVAQ